MRGRSFTATFGLTEGSTLAPVPGLEDGARRSTPPNDGAYLVFRNHTEDEVRVYVAPIQISRAILGNAIWTEF